MPLEKVFFNQTVTESEFKQNRSNVDLSLYTKSDASELEKIEDLLELRRGLLKSEDYYVNDSDCPGCGKKISFLDFVKTAVDENSHSKSFLVHALLGNKYGFQVPRTLKCSSCGGDVVNSTYRTPSYDCQER